METKNRFDLLNGINCNEHVEKKGNLSYLSWAWAWQIFKHHFPESYYTIYESPEGMLYHTDGNTCWVKTGVTLVDGDYRLEHVEFLPVMDNRNRSIPKDVVTSMDANTAVQRSLTKALARHGLGLYIYAGEDIPHEPTAEELQARLADKEPVKAAPAKISMELRCDSCGKAIEGTAKSTAQSIADKSKAVFGLQLCLDCAKKKKGETK